jgi:hypothetical protein
MTPTERTEGNTWTSNHKSILPFVRFATRRKTMITKSTFALIAAIAAVGVASPAFAQAFDLEIGTGNVQSINIGPAAPQQRSGLQAYAMVGQVQPRAHAYVAPNAADPAPTFTPPTGGWMDLH